VRALLVLLSATLIAAGCTASHPKAGAAPFATAERAVKATCGAYWFGRYIQHSGRKQIQWETRRQYNSGTGHVASLDRSPEGVRVTRCRAGAYTHG
jgi:nitrous oxide reductase accessory protein NosL